MGKLQTKDIAVANLLDFICTYDMGVSQEIPEPYLALLLYTHPDPRALDSCQSVGMLSDRKHSSLILMETGIKKGLSAGGRSYDRGTHNAVSPFVTLSILIAGVAGGLIIVIAFILFCKYCVKKKHGLSRDQGTDCERSSDRRFKPFQRYETINSDMFSEPSTGSMDGIPISPRRLYETKNHDKLPEAEEINETTKLKSDFEKTNYHETDLDIGQPVNDDLETEESEPVSEVPEVPVRRVSFQLDNLPDKTSGYLNKGRRYTEGDFHYLKKIRIDKRSQCVPRQYSLGATVLRDSTNPGIELFDLEPIPAVEESFSDASIDMLDESFVYPRPQIMDSPSPKSDGMETQIVNVEVHRGSNSINGLNGLRPHSVTFAKHSRSPTAIATIKGAFRASSHSMDIVSPSDISPRTNRRVKSYGDVADYDYDVLKITEFSTGPYFNNDLDTITELDNPTTCKVRYNDTGSLEVLNEDKLYMFDDFDFENIIPDESDADTETLNGTQKYREIWNLRTTLEEEEECSDTIRMDDMASPDEQSTDTERGVPYQQCNDSAQISNNHNHTNGHVSISPKRHIDSNHVEYDSSNLLHPNYENRRENFQNIVTQRFAKKGVNGVNASAENSFDSVETVDTDGDVSDTSRQEVTTTSFESNTDNTDSTNDSQTSRLRQMKADSGYKSLEIQQPQHANGTKKCHSLDDEIVVLESSAVPVSRNEEVLEGVGTSEPVTRRSSLFDKRKARTASKRRREYSRERQAVRLYESVYEPETDSTRSDQPSGDSFEEPHTPNSKFSVFSRFFKSQRMSNNKGLSRDFSIDEKSNDIFQEFVRYDPKYEEHRGSIGGFISNHRRHRFQRKYTDPGPGIFDETNRHWLSPEMRSTSLGSDSSASSARRISPQDSIEEELEDDIDAAVESHKNKIQDEESKPVEITTPSLSIHEIPIIKLPEGELVDV